MLEDLELQLSDLITKRDEYLKFARNDEDLNNEIRLLQSRIREIKNK